MNGFPVNIFAVKHFAVPCLHIACKIYITDVLQIDKTERMFIIERMRCVQCSACVDSCPKGCLSLDGHYIAPSIQKVTDAYDVPVKEKPRTSEQTSE